MHTLNEKDKKKIIGILLVLVPDARIYLFGSRARGTNAEYSDIDIALDVGSRIPVKVIDEAKAMLAESNIPYKIDIVDIFQVGEVMRNQILKERIIWK